MKRYVALVILVAVGVGTWQIGSKLSADAIGMAVGVIFGVMAGIPTALLLLVHERSRTSYQPAEPPPAPPPAPPVIILSGPGIIPSNRQMEGPTIELPERSWADVEDW